MEDRRVINDSYFCGRFRVDGPISVLTTTQYVVAEYDERTGDIRWQRVVNASQKEGIYGWLREHFPVKPETKPAAPITRKKQAAAVA
jgi:hypothetical protein